MSGIANEQRLSTLAFVQGRDTFCSDCAAKFKKAVNNNLSEIAPSRIARMTALFTIAFLLTPAICFAHSGAVINILINYYYAIVPIVTIVASTFLEFFNLSNKKSDSNKHDYDKQENKAD